MSMDRASPLGLFERYLSVWVALGITAGVSLGLVFPGLFQFVAGIEYANVNLVVAILIWVMIYPMMVNVDFASLKDVGRKPKGLSITLVVNWLVKPFTMAALGILFFEHIFAGLVSSPVRARVHRRHDPAGRGPLHGHGVRLEPARARRPNYTLVQVSINDIIMVFAFAPIAALLLGVTRHRRALGDPAAVGGAVRGGAAGGRLRSPAALLDSRQPGPGGFTARLKPFSVMGLIATVVLLFGLQAATILAKPLVIVLIAVPLLIQSYLIFLWPTAGPGAVPFSTAAPAAPDRHLELLRAGGGGGHQPVRPQLRRRPGDGGGRAGGGAGDAVAGGDVRQPQPCAATPENR
jgi:arsenite transporter